MLEIGCHGSTFSGMFDDAGLRRAIEGVAHAGFDLIELPIMRPEEYNVALAKQLLADNGLKVTASLGLTEELNISSTDLGVVAAGKDYLTRVIDILGELGAAHLVGVIYCPMGKQSAGADPVGVRNGKEALASLSERAADAGITIGVEVVNRYESNILNTSKQAVAYVKEINRPNVKVHLDTYHMNIEESGQFEPIVTAADVLSYVHIGESHRGYLGSGTVDFGSLFRALAYIKFDGPVVFESFSSAVVDPQLSSMLAIWRNLWDDGADLASHANRFIRDQIRAIQTIAMH